MRAPIRRVLALDAGDRCIRILVGKMEFGRFSILKEELIDMRAEGLLARDELKAHLLDRLAALGNPPIALVMPPHLTNSQVIELLVSDDQDIEKLIQDETVKLSGVSESRIIYDFIPVEAEHKNQQRFWVTLAREEDLRDRIHNLGLEDEDLCEIMPGAVALLAAYQACAPASSGAVLVHAGAQSTLMLVVSGGQGAFAASFQMGGDFFTRALARSEGIAEKEAEDLKHDRDLLNGPSALPEFCAAVDGWAAELKRQLGEWRAAAGPGSTAAGAGQSTETPTAFLRRVPTTLIATGGLFEQPGLPEYLRVKAGLNFQRWPRSNQAGPANPSKGFEPAFGAALQSLGLSRTRISLLPEDYRAKWRKQVAREKVEMASVVLLLVCALVLALGTWRQVLLGNYKQSLLGKVQSSQILADKNEGLTSRLASEYEAMRPAFASQQTTLDVLNSLSLLQNSRTNRSFWYVLLADQQTYFNIPRDPTNRLAATARTNSPDPSISLLAAFGPGNANANAATNAAGTRPGLISEVSIPEDAETSRILLSQLVKTLKQDQLFSKVDLLSEDLRRNLVDPKIVVPDRDYVLALDFAVADFEASARSRKAAASRAVTRRNPRASGGTAEDVERGNPPTP
jgi:hypothetical protein